MAEEPGNSKVGDQNLLLLSLRLKAAYQQAVRVWECRMCCLEWAAGGPSMSTWVCACACMCGPALCYFCPGHGFWGVPTSPFFACAKVALFCKDALLSFARRWWSVLLLPVRCLRCKGCCLTSVTNYNFPCSCTPETQLTCCIARVYP